MLNSSRASGGGVYPILKGKPPPPKKPKRLETCCHPFVCVFRSFKHPPPQYLKNFTFTKTLLIFIGTPPPRNNEFGASACPPERAVGWQTRKFDGLVGSKTILKSSFVGGFLLVTFSNFKFVPERLQTARTNHGIFLFQRRSFGFLKE